MGYTAQSMAAAAERHYRDADARRQGDKTQMLSSIAESLCGLLAMQLSRYADEPHDNFDDDDELSGPYLGASEHRVRITDVQLPDSEPEVVDPYSIHRAMREMREYQNAGTTCPHCDSNPCRCAEIVTAEADNG